MLCTASNLSLKQPCPMTANPTPRPDTALGIRGYKRWSFTWTRAAGEPVAM